jgi:hypothetical protein
LTPFVERLATEEEKEAGTMSPEVVCRSPAELQQRDGEEHRQGSGSPGSGRREAGAEAR